MDFFQLWYTNTTHSDLSSHLQFGNVKADFEGVMNNFITNKLLLQYLKPGAANIISSFIVYKYIMIQYYSSIILPEISSV